MILGPGFWFYNSWPGCHPLGGYPGFATHLQACLLDALCITIIVAIRTFRNVD